MNCRGFEGVLERYLAAELSPAESAAAARHLGGCERCGELLELARIATRPADPRSAPPPDLVADVMSKTAGPGCDAAERVLCDFLDGSLAEDRARLVEAHLSGCAGCRALAGALASLASDLPRLAEIRPDARFVDAVLAATLPLRVRLARWWRVRWPHWVARPRFAAEAAYATTLIVVLVFSTPGSPLEAMPRRAAELAQRSAPLAALSDPWASAEAMVAPRLEALKSAGATRALSARWRRTLELGAKALDRARELGGGAREWTAERIRTFRHALASVLERAGEEPAPTEQDSDEEK